MRRVLVPIVMLLILGIGIVLWARARSTAKSSAGDLQTVRVERGTELAPRKRTPS